MTLATIPGMNAKEVELAHKATKAYLASQKLLREWQSIARVLSRNPNLTLELSWHTAATDGSKILIKVPMELGEDISHDRDLCGKRDQEQVLTCPMCATLEDVTITVIHEVAHLIADTFKEVHPGDLAQIVRDAVRTDSDNISESRQDAKIRKAVEAFGNTSPHYMQIAGAVSPFLPFLFNAVEDVRVNGHMMRERPGTRKMFAAQSSVIFGRGIARPNGTVFQWSEAPPNAQAGIAVYCKASGIPIEGRLSDDIVERLDDDTIDDLCKRMVEAKSARAAFKLTLPLLRRLRELGFMLAPEEEEPEPEDTSDEHQDSEESQDTEQEQDDDSSDGGEASSDEADQAGQETGEDSDAATQDDAENPGSATEDGDEVDDPGTGTSANEAADEDGSSDGENTDADGQEQSQDGGVSDEVDGDSDGGESDLPSESDGDRDSSSDEGDDPQGQDDASSESASLEEVDGDDGGDDERSSPASADQGHRPGPPEDTDGSEVQDSPSGPDSPVKDNGDSSQPYTEEDLERDGTPEEVEELFKIFGRHGEEDEDSDARRERHLSEEAIKRSLQQAEVFDRPSGKIIGLNVHTFKDSQNKGAWRNMAYFNTEVPDVPERIMAPALQRLRLAFQYNAQGAVYADLRSGRVNARVLGRRVPTGDDRLFYKKTEPGKRDHFVTIGLDVSGSTDSWTNDGRIKRIDLIKAAAFAKAELLHRLGVNFAVYAHTGHSDAVDIYQVKGPNDKWGRKEKESLANLVPYWANLDGHTLEFYRKVTEKRPETDRIILYYTDGAMPLANFKEELMILKEEIEICRKREIRLVGIGVETDSPEAHGLDTIQLDGIEDVPNVITELRKRLT